jgi:hypothetical protein
MEDEIIEGLNKNGLFDTKEGSAKEESSHDKETVCSDVVNAAGTELYKLPRRSSPTA